MSVFSLLRRHSSRSAPPHPATEHDRLIAEHIARELARELPDRGDMQFLVHHGTVILKSAGLDTLCRGEVMRIVSGVAGVRRVIDRSTVAGVPLPTAA